MVQLPLIMENGKCLLFVQIYIVSLLAAVSGEKRFNIEFPSQSVIFTLALSAYAHRLWKKEYC